MVKNKKIVAVKAEIEKDYKKLSSLKVNYNEKEDVINLSCPRYRGLNGRPSDAQICYLIGFDNIDYQSKYNLRKGNKWFISACINIVKKYSNINFNIIL